MQVVDFYFDFSSTNSYFAAFMLPDICCRHDAIVNWIPLHLGALFRETGFDVMAMTPRKARYLWRDHQRYAELTGLPFRRPRRFPIKTADALRGVIASAHLSGTKRGTGAGADAARVGARVDLTCDAAARYSQAVMRAYWERDENIADRAVLAATAESAGLDRDGFIRLIDSEDVRDELTSITGRAAERGVFGAPMFFVGAEMFWGKDRLDFVERWLIRRSH
jgi:2-hydroxychromene-2-carboxylate isomerase